MAIPKMEFPGAKPPSNGGSNDGSSVGDASRAHLDQASQRANDSHVSPLVPVAPLSPDFGADEESGSLFDDEKSLDALLGLSDDDEDDEAEVGYASEFSGHVDADSGETVAESSMPTFMPSLGDEQNAEIGTVEAGPSDSNINGTDNVGGVDTAYDTVDTAQGWADVNQLQSDATQDGYAYDTTAVGDSSDNVDNAVGAYPMPTFVSQDENGYLYDAEGNPYYSDGSPIYSPSGEVLAPLTGHINPMEASQSWAESTTENPQSADSVIGSEQYALSSEEYPELEATMGEQLRAENTESGPGFAENGWMSIDGTGADEPQADSGTIVEPAPVDSNTVTGGQGEESSESDDVDWAALEGIDPSIIRELMSDGYGTTESTDDDTESDLEEAEGFEVSEAPPMGEQSLTPEELARIEAILGSDDVDDDLDSQVPGEDEEDSDSFSVPRARIFEDDSLESNYSEDRPEEDHAPGRNTGGSDDSSGELGDKLSDEYDEKDEENSDADGERNSKKSFLGGVKSKFGGFLNDAMKEMKGGSADDPDPNEVGDEAEDDEKEEQGRKKPSGSRGGGFALLTPVKKVLSPFKKLYMMLVNVVFSILSAVLGILRKIPIIGKLFKPLLAAEKILRYVATSLPLVVLIGVMVFVGMKSVPGSSSVELPDSGGATFSSFTYDSEKKEASGVITNTGEVIAEVQPTFVVKTLQPSLNPLSWFIPSESGKCEGKFVRVDIDGNKKVTVKCDFSGGMFPRVSGGLNG